MQRSPCSLSKKTARGSFGALLGLLLSSGAAVAAAVSFIGLSTFGGSCNGATGVSSDGSIVVGWVGDVSDGVASLEAARWVDAGPPEPLGTLPGHPNSVASDVSADGSVVVGASLPTLQTQPSEPPNEAFRWTQASGMVGLGRLPGDTWSTAAAVSADGSVVVGVSGEGSSAGGEPFRWTQTTGMAGLGFLPGDDVAEVRDVSADGAVVVGHSTTHGPGQTWAAFRWTQAGGMTSLLGFVPGEASSRAYATSADGLVVVGSWSGLGVEGQAFRWKHLVGLTLLDSLPGLPVCTPLDVTPDGRVILGVCRAVSGGSSALFRWDEHYGMRNVGTLLTDLGIDLSDWERLFALVQITPWDFALALSLDGRTMVGAGEIVAETLDMRPWLAEIPSCYDGIDNDGDGLVDHPNDPDCAGISDDTELLPACSDGLDNDGDGENDFPDDPGCSATSSVRENPQCDDGLDNDGDGKIDFAPPDGFQQDPQCTTAWANREARRRGCGLLGIESLPFAIALSARTRRRRS